MTKRIKNIPSFSEGASMNHGIPRASMNHGIPHQTPSSPGKKGLSMDAFFFPRSEPPGPNGDFRGQGLMRQSQMP